MPSPIGLLLVETKGAIGVGLDAETDCRSIRVGELAGVLGGFRWGSQALCGIKEACDC